MALLPVGFFAAGLGAPDFTSASAVLNLLGRLAGVVGLALLLLAAALSARVPGVDLPFGGLTKLWRTHHLLGAGSLLLLLVHPLLLAFAASAWGQGLAFGTLFPPLSDRATWAGWLALLLMMVFLAPSFAFFGAPKYERWKRLHSLAGPAVILALIHTFLLSRTMPGPTDTIIWSLFALLGVGAVGWRLVFSRRIGRLPYTVTRVDTVADGVAELSLKPDRDHLRYSAGNFVYLTPFDTGLAAGHREEHPYTLSSSPLEPELRIAIKALGDASRAIQTIPVGTPVTVEGPYGCFFPPDSKARTAELWVAGGVGITPFLARMRHLRALGEGGDIHLVYAVQDESRAVYAGELRQLAAEIPGFALTFHYFFQEGPVTAPFLGTACPDLARREVYICGPLALNQLVRDHVYRAGVSADHIHSEEFELL
ncbi:MAG: ferric reductase-like transmembrane domain-containing protein [Haliea sp.]|uniref:ferredoxin reductase family protein n=1 Tax=Haliea sp. TaxID=1932666 RepID=UPI0032EF2E7B